MRKDRLTVLRPAKDGDVFSWREEGGLWAAVEATERTSLFSKVGIGAREGKLVTVPRRDLSLHDALRWQGKHLVLTAITNVNPARMEVAAALVEPVPCEAARAVKTQDERGKPVYSPVPLCSFPGILTEKYLGFVQKEPQGAVEHRMVLVTPKGVLLKTGDLVATAQGEFIVRVCYLLDEYKHEYEIANAREA